MAGPSIGLDDKKDGWFCLEWGYKRRGEVVMVYVLE